ncbi:uncharacterized protein L203_100659 [Cryptococcus depauperatus CBS 7841]|uniref:Uncharacterized protein n=1 Tax=Cryptococcus depauperatus CBS 7841 TaxID=1295531 RepID=A0A1E3IXM2_9TREE|nr:hypothetical protein L203_00444 [Cryptococcus depauperatus CBS 7841]
MGNNQSYNRQYRPRQEYHGVSFAAHHGLAPPPYHPGKSRGKRSRRDIDKPLPHAPKSKCVSFGANSTPWVFYKHRPPDENIANTRYCHRSYLDVGSDGNLGYSPPPAYGAWIDINGYIVHHSY